MFERHVLGTLIKVVILREVHFRASASVRLLLSPKVRLGQLTRANACSILQKKLNYMDMQPPCGIETASLLEVDILMEHDGHELPSETVAGFDTDTASVENASSSVQGHVSPGETLVLSVVCNYLSFRIC